VNDVYNRAAQICDEIMAAGNSEQRPWPSGPLGDALLAFPARLNAIQYHEAHNGTSLLRQDPRDLAAVIERLARAAQLEGLVSTFETIGAYAMAGLVAAARAEETRVDTGDAA
jgi:hypothetical protein